MSNTAAQGCNESRRPMDTSFELSRTNSRLNKEDLSTVSNDTTLRLLENMDDDQIDEAIEGFRAMALKRQATVKASNLTGARRPNEDDGKITPKSYYRPKSSRDQNGVQSIDEDAVDAQSVCGKEMGVPKKLPSKDEDGRTLSKSVHSAGAGQYMDDYDSEEDDNKPFKRAPEQRRASDIMSHPEYLKKNNTSRFQRIESGSYLNGLAEMIREEEGVEEEKSNEIDHGQDMSTNQSSNPNKNFHRSSSLPTPPIPSLSTPPRQECASRRTSLSNSGKRDQWKPLTRPSIESIDENKEEGKNEESYKNGQDEANQGGIGGLWNKFRRSLTTESASQNSPQVPKNVDAAKYYRRGKRRADKCQFLEAVALFNFALMRQREELGKNHVDCGRTLNEIGICWLMLGERYPAMNAFEESLFILQRTLGDGAEEVAEVTNNIWMVLHEQRKEALTGDSNRNISLKG